jgi:hypothetical protein
MKVSYTSYSATGNDELQRFIFTAADTIIRPYSEPASSSLRHKLFL